MKLLYVSKDKRRFDICVILNNNAIITNSYTTSRQEVSNVHTSGKTELYKKVLERKCVKHPT